MEKIRQRGGTPAAHAATYEEVKESLPFHFNVVKSRAIWFIVSGAFIILSIGSVLVQSLNFGVDFTGGSMLDIKFNQAVTQQAITDTMDSLGLEGNTVQLSEDNTTALIRTSALEEEERNQLIEALRTNVGDFDQENFKEDKVGPAIGKELTANAIKSLCLAAILMLAYMAFRFKFSYGISAVAGLLFTVFFTVGIFSIFKWEVDSTFVAAILTIFGYAINDTVVIFDRIRENEPRMKKKDSFEDMVDKSIWQMMGRSIKTTVTVALALLAILLFGGESTKGFALAMLIGVIAGAYSSIFNASQFLVEIKKRTKGKDRSKPSKAKA
ncbi:MAG: protein translocase subunit SecF [Desulfitobacterium sp.]|nr:protein translocase subunit SecF [Desulfitobacterium sp.]